MTRELRKAGTRRPLAGVKLAAMLCIAPMTVTQTSWTPGRARSKPLTPLRREGRREPAYLWWTYSYAFSFLHARLRVQTGIRLSLRPLFFRGDDMLARLGLIAPRECERMFSGLFDSFNRALMRIAPTLPWRGRVGEHHYSDARRGGVQQ